MNQTLRMSWIASGSHSSTRCATNPKSTHDAPEVQATVHLEDQHGLSCLGSQGSAPLQEVGQVQGPAAIAS